MKRLLLLLPALAAAFAASAQIPKPGYLLSDLYHRQCGIADYCNERFDFSRFALRRDLSAFFVPGDTTLFKKYIHDVDLCDASGRVARIRFQDRVQTFCHGDTLLRVYVHNPSLECTVMASLPPDASDERIARAVDSLGAVRALPLSGPSAGPAILPAGQDGLSYALQYLFARCGIDTAPLFSWETLIVKEYRAALLDRCCIACGAMKIGSDIERFVRRARFDEACIYCCLPSSEERTPLYFFYADGRFWCKIGMSEYVSYDSFEALWRHDKRMTRLVAYRLRDEFR